MAPGPGYTVIDLAKLGDFRVTGMDISATFVEIGRRNALEAGVVVDFQRGDAASLPFPDNSFDFIVCRAAFKNFSQPLPALLEMHRVLRRRGTALIVDLRPDVTPEAVDHYIRKSRRTRASAAFMRWTFLHMLRKTAHSKEEFEDLVSRTAFSGHEIREDPLGYEVWLYKE